MSIFEKASFEFRGKEYVIHADKMMMAIAVVEEVITLFELQKYQQRGTVALSKMAMAYGALLRFAGATVTDEDVYAAMFSDDENSSSVITSVTTLMLMMVPPDELISEGKNTPIPKSRGAANLSKKRTKRLSRRKR